MGELLDPTRLAQFDRLPPHSIEAEMCLLASLMLDKEMIGVVVLLVQRDMFYQTDHQIIFEMIVKLWELNKPIDAVIVREELVRRQLFEEVGGVPYLAQILGSVPSAAHAAHYAGIVREKYLLRQMITVANETLRDAYAPHEKADDQLAKLVTRTFELAEQKQVNQLAPVGEAAHEFFDSLDQPREGDLDTGFYELDDMLDGLHNGELILIAARPSMGKTSLAGNIIEHIAIDKQRPVGFFSMEMGARQLIERMACSLAGVDSHRVRKRILTSQDFQKLAQAVHDIERSKLWIDDTAVLDVTDLRAKARRMQLRAGLAGIFVDYLQLMTAPGAESRQQEITTISRGLKAVARDLNVPVIALSQLNRSAEIRKGCRSRMRDLL